eukprot:snap_masked-scaffold_41-processed-gene-1.12-mRNA-1 protein AED:1.00 eAED:1.00 QI:0/-1/0/0/-1/1/1/0/62
MTARLQHNPNVDFTSLDEVLEESEFMFEWSRKRTGWREEKKVCSFTPEFFAAKLPVPYEITL